MDTVERSKQKLRIEEAIQYLEKMKAEIDNDLITLKVAFKHVDSGELDIRSKDSIITNMLATETRGVLIKLSDFRESRVLYKKAASFYFSERIDR